MSSHRNNAASALPGADAGAGMDGFGRAYPAEELGEVAALLSVPADAWGGGAADNVSCDGQRIELPRQTRVTGLVVLGACAGGSFRDTLVLDDSDGNAYRAPFALTDFLAARPRYDDECHFIGSLLRENGKEVVGPRPRLFRHQSMFGSPRPCTALILPINPDIHLFGLWLLTGGVQHEVPTA